MQDDANKPDPNEGVEDFDVNSLAESLLNGAKEEEKKPDAKDKGEEAEKPEAGAEEKPAEGEKPADKKEGEEKPADKPADGDKPAEGDAAAEKPEDKPSDTAEEAKPLTREDIREAMREEQKARDDAAAQRSTYSGQMRDTIREDLKLDSTYTTVALDDGTPITSVEQLTSVINPNTDEPYTREEAATLLLDARKVVDDNMKAYESRVDAADRP